MFKALPGSKSNIQLIDYETYVSLPIVYIGKLKMCNSLVLIHKSWDLITDS